MCGIAGYFDIDGKHPPTAQLAIAWSLLAARGMDAAGAMWGTGDKVLALKEPQCSYDIALPAWFKRISPTRPQWAAVHSRAASKGATTDAANNHPVAYGNILVTHNGIVSNDGEVFTKLGVARRAAVDTEAIAACLHVGGLPKVLELVRGSIVMAWADVTKPTELHLYCNGGALWASYSAGEFVSYASTEFYMPSALLGNKRGEVPVGMHLILSPGGIVEDQIGTGATHTPPRVVPGAYAPAGAAYNCYDKDTCHVVHPHTHHFPSYPFTLHKHDVEVREHV